MVNSAFGHQYSGLGSVTDSCRHLWTTLCQINLINEYQVIYRLLCKLSGRDRWQRTEKVTLSLCHCFSYRVFHWASSAVHVQSPIVAEFLFPASMAVESIWLHNIHHRCRIVFIIFLEICLKIIGWFVFMLLSSWVYALDSGLNCRMWDALTRAWTHTSTHTCGHMHACMHREREGVGGGW